MYRRLIGCLFVAALAALAQPGQPAPAQASQLRDPNGKQAPRPAALEGVGIDQKLDQQIPLDLTFLDEGGRPVRLSTYFGNKPVLLALVYYQCPMLCTQILNGMETSLRAVSLDPGKDFEVVTVSFDPADTPDIALQKKLNYVRRYGRPNTANGWHFLSGNEASIKALTDAVGFHYTYDAKTRQFAHASGIFILTPQGKLSRYFYGVEYSSRDIRLGLVEASHNKIGNPVDQILLFCYHYDPATGKYGAIAMNMVRAGGATFVLVCGSFLLVMWRRDFRNDRRSQRRA